MFRFGEFKGDFACKSRKNRAYFPNFSIIRILGKHLIFGKVGWIV